MADFLFANPSAFWLLCLIPIFLFWYNGFFRSRRLVINLSYDPVAVQPPRFRLGFLRHLPLFLQVVGLIALIIALARPQLSSDHQVREKEGIDLMLLLDTSASMEADDFPPNRLAVAKQTAINFVEGREGDRIGLVLFAEEAFSYAPLTLDYGLLNKMIEAINFQSLPKQGTALGSAIAAGINRLRESPSPTRIMILITDGSSNRGKLDPLTAARLAETFNIKIYCVGVGQKMEEPGVNQGPQNSDATLDEVTLKAIAQLTNGRYFHAVSTQKLEEIFEEISQLEQVTQAEEVYRQVSDKYPFFLKIGLGCFALAFLLMLTFMYNLLEL